MTSSPDAINGTEQATGADGAMDALIAFYQAFNGRDLDALARNWAGGGEPSMDNPIGGIRRGWEEIGAGYERLFNGPARVWVEFFDYTESSGAGFHLFAGRERGFCETAETKFDLRIRTSRLFVQRDGLWKQIHHHGSIEEPALLEAYQSAILGGPLVARL